MSYNTAEYILENQNEIEEKIAYHFRNKKLLVQSFTRKSFSQENDEFEDNEILEYYGDQLVNTVMTKWLFDSYSTVPQSYSNDFFYSQKNESELTKIRANYVNKSALAHCIEISGLDEYLLLEKVIKKIKYGEMKKSFVMNLKQLLAESPLILQRGIPIKSSGILNKLRNPARKCGKC